MPKPIKKLKDLLIRLFGIRVTIASKGSETFTVPEGKYHLVKNREQRKVPENLEWLVNYMTEEAFPVKHIEAINHIVGLFNDSEESEKEIFEFADKLYKKHAS